MRLGSELSMACQYSPCSGHANTFDSRLTFDICMAIGHTGINMHCAITFQNRNDWSCTAGVLNESNGVFSCSRSNSSSTFFFMAYGTVLGLKKEDPQTA